MNTSPRETTKAHLQIHRLNSFHYKGTEVFVFSECSWPREKLLSSRLLRKSLHCEGNDYILCCLCLSGESTRMVMWRGTVSSRITWSVLFYGLYWYGLSHLIRGKLRLNKGKLLMYECCLWFLPYCEAGVDDNLSTVFWSCYRIGRLRTNRKLSGRRASHGCHGKSTDI